MNFGYPLLGIAVDDTHKPRNFFGGWTMVCAKEKNPTAVMNALKSDAVYTSQGLEFYKLSFVNNIFSAECSPCEEILVMGNGSFGRCGNMSGFEATTPEARYKTTEMSSFDIAIPYPTNQSNLPALPDQGQHRQLRLKFTDKNRLNGTRQAFDGAHGEKLTA